MHKVCNIRDLSLRASLPRPQMWAAYARDLESLLDKAMEGGFASINSQAAQLRQAA